MSAPQSIATRPATQPAKFRPLLAAATVLPFCIGYFMSFYFRTVNALFAGQLTSELGLGAAELGLLTAAYFGTAALMQLPVGFALDRFGPRRVQIFSLAIATVGASVFAIAQTFWPLFLGRALIGVGVASALVAAIKVVALRFPAERAGLLNGIIVASGALGAIAASAPSELLLAQMNWHEMYAGIAAVTGLVWLLHVVIAPRDSVVAASAAGASGFRSVFTDRRFWRFAPMAALVIGTAWAYHGLWLAVWLADAAHKPPATVVQLLLLTAITFGIGALSYGVLLEVLRRYGVGPAPVMVIVALLLVTIELAMAIHPSLPAVVPAAMLGFVSAATVLSFTTLRGLFDVALVGRANGLLNSMNFGMAFVIQSGFGVVVGLGGRDATGHYVASAFAPALLICAVLKLLAVLWYLSAPSDVPMQSRHWRRAGYAAVMPLLVLAGVRLMPPEHVSTVQAFVTPSSPAISQSIVPPSTPLQRDALLETVRRLDAELLTGAAREERLLAALTALKSESEGGRQQLQTVALRLAAIEHSLGERALAAAPLAAAPTVQARPIRSADTAGMVESVTSHPVTKTGPCHAMAMATSAVATFGPDQSTVEARSISGHNELVSVVRQCIGVRLLVEGFSDPRGSEAANRALARRRAEKVATYFASLGIERSRIVVADTTADDKRPRFRRVDVSLVLETGPRERR